MRQLNQFMGLIGLSVVPSKRRRTKGNIDRHYIVDPTRLAVMRNLAASYRDFESAADRRGSPKRAAE